MPFKPSKGKSPPSSDPTYRIGPMTLESSLTKAEYSYQTKTISDKTSSNYIMTTRQLDTLVT